MKKLFLIFVSLLTISFCFGQEGYYATQSTSDTVQLSDGAWTSSTISNVISAPHQFLFGGTIDSVSGYIRYVPEVYFSINGVDFFPTGVKDTISTGTTSSFSLQATTPWNAKYYKLYVTPIDSTQAGLLKGDYNITPWK